MELASLGLSIDSRQVRTASGDLDRFSRSGQGAERSAGRVGTTFGGASASARRMAGALGAAVGGLLALGSAVRTISEFERSMSQVEAITRATSGEMVALRDIAATLGSTTEFTASQAAGGLRFLGMAGFTAAESIAAIPAVLDLATAASMDLAQAADTSSNIMSAFGIAAENAADVADVLAAASSRANTDVSQLGSAMAFVGPVASALGVDLGDAAAAVGVLSDAGIQGSAAGTGLRRVLSSLANPTGEAAEALQRLGATLEQVNPATNDIVEIVGRLADTGLSAADALTIFGDRGGPAILALVSQNDRLRELTDELGNVEGEASRMATTMRDNLQGDIDSLWSSVQGLMLALGDAGLTAILRGVIGLTTEIVRSIISLVEAFDRMTSATGRAIARLLGMGGATDTFAASAQLAADAINQEIAQSDALTGSLTIGREMSIDIAGVKLAQARAHLASADAQRQEHLATIRAGEGYLELVDRQDEIQRSLAETRAQLEMFEGDAQLEGFLLNQMQDQLAALRSAVAAQQDLLAVAGETDAEYAAAVATIELIETALANATGDTIILGDATGDAADEGERLADAISGINFSAALAGAEALAERLNVSVGLASAIATAAGSYGADAAGAVFDPRSPRFSQELQDRANLEAELARIRQSFEDTTSAALDFGDAVSGDGGTAGAVSALADELEPATTFAGGFAEALQKGARTAVDMGRELGGALLRGIDSVSSAFGDFVARGFRDFQGFAQSVLDTFRNLLSQMIAMAVRNRIMIGLGISASPTAALAKGATGGGGLLGNVFGLGGGGGGLLGSFGSTGGILGFGGLGGGTGLLGGLGNALSGGLGNIFSIGANAAAAGGGVLASLGAAIPVLGIAAAAFALFRTRTKQVDNGIRATVGELDTLVEQFKIIKKVRVFGGRSYRTTYSPADDETTDYITSTIDTLRDSVTAAADALGFGAETFEGFAHEMRVSFYGMDDDEAQAALADALGGVSDAMAEMIPGLADWRRETETSTDTLNRLAGGLVAANDAFDLLGFRLYDISLAGGDAASAFVEMFGTIEDFQTATGSYYQNFYTEAERAAKATERLTAELLALGVDGLPASRAAYRALVDEAKAFGDDDLTASLMKLAPAFASITGQANALADMFGQNALFRTRADQTYAATSGGYTKSIAQVQQEQGAEMADLLQEVVRAIREGDINNARINTKILAIQERLDLEPTA